MQRPKVTLALCMMIVFLMAITFAAFRYATTPLASGEMPDRMWAMHLAIITVPICFLLYARTVRA